VARTKKQILGRIAVVKAELAALRAELHALDPQHKQRYAGYARAEALTSEQRSAIAKKAAASRWKT
jgi:hypothetical protein